MTDVKSSTTLSPLRRDYWHVLVMPEYRPGDLPPEGYLQWHEWADVQRKAGIKQVKCPTCCLWRTPQELSTYQRAPLSRQERLGVVTCSRRPRWAVMRTRQRGALPPTLTIRRRSIG